MSKKKAKIRWLVAPADGNYPSALSYLSLLFDEAKARQYVGALKQSPMSEFKARDIFRASGLPLLGISQHQIERNYNKINDGEKLSPILLIRDEIHGKVIIADGYHRVCAVYHYNDDSVIPCEIV